MVDLNNILEDIKKEISEGKMLGRVTPKSPKVIDQISRETEFLDDIYKNRKIRTVDRVFCLINNIISKEQIPICVQCNNNYSIFLTGGKTGFSKVCGQKCGTIYGGIKNRDPETSKKAAITRKQTIQKRYNVDYISQIKGVNEKKKETAIKNYGSLKAAYYDTSQKTIEKKYNIDNISKLDFIKEKKKETSRKNYGTNFPWQSNKGKKEQKQGVINKHSIDNISKLEEIKEKKKKTNIKNHGVENYSKTPQFIESVTGPNNPNWKGGITAEPYCDIWLDKEYKQSIKARDGNRCLNPYCFKTNKKLVIHHIDYNKKNCHPLNLITVCDPCNGRANKDRDWHKSWYQAIIYKRYGTRGI